MAIKPSGSRTVNLPNFAGSPKRPPGHDEYIPYLLTLQVVVSPPPLDTVIDSLPPSLGEGFP